LSEKKSYDTTYEALDFYWIGGLWGYAIIRLKDYNGEHKIRLAKCKKKQGFPNTDKFEWWKVNPEHIKELSQVNKINFKRKGEFESCYGKVLERFKELENIQEKEENKPL